MFSNAIKLADLNDFLSPSQECVLPLLSTADNKKANQTAESSSSQQDTKNVEFTNSIKPNLIKLKSKKKDKASTERLKSSAKDAADLELRNGRTNGLDAVDAVAPGEFNTGKSIKNGEGAPATIVGEVLEAQASGYALHAHPKPSMKDTTEAEKQGEIMGDAASNVKGREKHEMVGQVSLNDCLACSGCVTTAETVLLKEHSVNEFLKRVKTAPVSVVSISPQSRTALCKFYDLSAKRLMRKLTFFFKGLGVQYVVDTSLSEAICLLEAQHEFVARFKKDFPDYKTSYRRNRNDEASREKRDEYYKPLEAPLGTGAEHTGIHDLGQVGEQPQASAIGASPSVGNGNRWPLLASHCPGWICYAEKVLDKSVIPHISRVRSSQQIQGLLVKSLLRQSHNSISFLRSYRQSMLSLRFPFPLSSPRDNTTDRPSHYTYALWQKRLLRCIECTWHKNRAVAVRDVFGDATNFSSETMYDVWSSVLMEEGTADGATKASRSERAEPNGNCFRYVDAEDIYHACIMPCYDKKIESARPDFVQPEDVGKSITEKKVMDVDTVLATSEILELFRIFNINIHKLDEIEVDDLAAVFSATLRRYETSHGSTRQVPNDKNNWGIMNEFTKGNAHVDAENSQHNDSGSGALVPSDMKDAYKVDTDVIYRIAKYNGASGGFVDAIFRYAAYELYGVDIEGPLKYKIGKNKDYKEVTLEVDGAVVLRFVVAYGFRNVQNVVRRLNIHAKPIYNPQSSSKASQLNTIDYVEIMACPGGCLNGGGQKLEVQPTESDALRTDISGTTSTKPADELNDIGGKLYEKSSADQCNMNANKEHEKMEKLLSNVTSSDGSKLNGVSKIKAQQKDLDVLERMFHYDEEIPYVRPDSIPMLSSVYRYLLSREGSNFAEHDLPYGRAMKLLTQFKSLSESHEVNNEGALLLSSALKW